MKRKGFTLIELLAVIVVLAIIALIATPIVMNVIKNAQKGATERSAERYLSAVETAIATDRLENGQIADGTYEVNEDGNLVLGEKTLTVEVSGDRPEAGSKVAIENGQVVATGTNMTIGDYTVTINDKGSATATAKEDVVALCNAIVPTTQNVWNSTSSSLESKTVGVQATSEAPYAVGSVYSCNLGDGARTFYVLREDGDNVKLIMNENLGYSAWAESGDNSEGPVTANAYLASQTSGWTKLSQSQITLPDAQDIADAMGDSEWADNNYTGTYGPDWMRTNLDIKNLEYAHGYWTSTTVSDDSNYAWTVDCYGALDYYGNMDFSYVYYDIYYGVRPVITISKSNLSL